VRKGSVYVIMGGDHTPVTYGSGVFILGRNREILPVIKSFEIFGK
jgi:hypothetical protein